MSVEITQVCSAVMEHVAHGVAVLTLIDDAGVRRGMTVGSLTAASAEPPTVLVCIRNRASMHPFLTPGRPVGLSILGPGQSAVSNGFAFGVEDPFAVFPCHAEAGVPIVVGGTAYLTGRVDRALVNHDTTVVIVGVDHGAVLAEGALVHWMRDYYGGLVPVGG
ncbi:MAG TPA: hypothetical protein DCY40_08670 [Actinobacteria bacterium]|nr:hypothetical protein [Actinomycetota bacterium]